MSKAPKYSTNAGNALSNVVDLAAARAARAIPTAPTPTEQRIDLGDDAIIVTTEADGRRHVVTESWLRRTYFPTVRTLPFIGKDESGEVASYWAEPAGATHQDGRDWATATIEAFAADGCGGFPLEHIFCDMIAARIKHRDAGGKGSRATLTTAMDGFLRELSIALTAGKAVA